MPGVIYFAIWACSSAMNRYALEIMLQDAYDNTNMHYFALATVLFEAATVSLWLDALSLIGGFAGLAFIGHCVTSAYWQVIFCLTNH